MHLVAALDALAPAPDANFRAWEAAIRRVATLLLQACTIRAGDLAMRAVEVEGYVHAPWHPDPFVHADAMQNTLGRWYFHRIGGSFRGGTFKGVDLSFGRVGAAASMLLRAVRLADGTRIEGPSLVVDRILAATGHATVASLARACAGEDHDALRIDLDVVPPRADAIYAVPRVGLSLRAEVTEPRVFFLPRPYRFVVEPRATRKGRASLVVGMHLGGLEAPAIASLTGAALAQVHRWIAAYASGRGCPPASLRTADEAESLCALLGACAAVRTG